MTTTQIRQEPRYVPYILAIERRIDTASRAAKQVGVEFNDSQVRSVLNKVRKSLEGGAPKIPGGAPREELLAALHHDLLHLQSEFLADDGGQATPLPIRARLLCIKVVEESIQKNSTGPGSQAYLDFLVGFIARANALTR